MTPKEESVRVRGRTRAPRWARLNAAAVAMGGVLVIVALTVRDHGSPADPDQVLHSYTLVQSTGAGILALVGAPAMLSVAAGWLLHLKSTRRSERAGRAAWWLTCLICTLCLFGLPLVGAWALPPAVLQVAASALAPLAGEHPTCRRWGSNPRPSD